MAVVLAALATVACGQKGALYLPQAESEIVTRPTQTPAGTQSPVAAPDAPTEAPAEAKAAAQEPARPQ